MSTVRFTVTPKQLGLYERSLVRALRRETIAASQVKAAKESLRLLQKRTREARPASRGGGPGAVDTEAFLKGWEVQPRGRYVSVRNTAPHAVYVELGRRAHATPPPIAALVPWVRRKLGLRGKAARAAARAIARKIGMRGLRGRFIQRGAMPAIRAVHLRTVTAGLDKALKDAAP